MLQLVWFRRICVSDLGEVADAVIAVGCACSACTLESLLLAMGLGWDGVVSPTQWVMGLEWDCIASPTQCCFSLSLAAPQAGNLGELQVIFEKKMFGCAGGRNSQRKVML